MRQMDVCALEDIKQIFLVAGPIVVHLGIRLCAR